MLVSYHSLKSPVMLIDLVMGFGARVLVTLKLKVNWVTAVLLF